MINNEPRDFDERHVRIQVLLDVLGDFNNLTDELAADPPCYSEIIDCIEGMIETLKDAKAHLLKIKISEIKKDIANRRQSS